MGNYVSRTPDEVPLPRLSYVVGRLDRALAIALGDRVAAYGLSLPQYTALSVLELHSGLSNAQLARRVLVRPQSMVQVVAALEDRGLIERLPAPDHGRILRTRITRQGKTILKRCNEDVAELERDMLSDIPAKDRGLVLGALISCVRRLGGGFDTVGSDPEAKAELATY